MSAEELLAEGELEPAIAAQIAVVKSRPTDADARYLLFALLCFNGEWERAVRQLDALSVQDEKIQAGSLVYRNLLASELDRGAVFQGEGRPLLPDDPPDHAARRLAALDLVLAGDFKGAEAAIDEAVSGQPEVAGSLNGTPFIALRDQDDLLGSVLEVFAGGRYLWLPFERLRKLEITAPGHLLDLLWLPASLEDVDGTVANVHVPSLYPQTAAATDGVVRLGRRTDWLDLEGCLFRGQGQRIIVHADQDAEAEATPIAAVRQLIVRN